MNTQEQEALLNELETRVDRLRVLYDQYFLGFEKLEPTVPRKDVDRRFAVLRKEQIRNTALRFRFNVVTQRYNTYAMYWMRICRQIEDGTYKRHVQRARQRFQSVPPPAASASKGAEDVSVVQRVADAPASIPAKPEAFTFDDAELDASLAAFRSAPPKAPGSLPPPPKMSFAPLPAGISGRPALRPAIQPRAGGPLPPGARAPSPAASGPSTNAVAPPSPASPPHQPAAQATRPASPAPRAAASAPPPIPAIPSAVPTTPGLDPRAVKFRPAAASASAPGAAPKIVPSSPKPIVAPALAQAQARPAPSAPTASAPASQPVATDPSRPAVAPVAAPLRARPAIRPMAVDGPRAPAPSSSDETAKPVAGAGADRAKNS